MSSKKRPYRVTNEDTGAEHMVLAISQAQAISYVARSMFTITAASGMDVANHAMAGGKIEDAGTAPASGSDSADTPESGATERGEWEQHRSGGIADRAGIAD